MAKLIPSIISEKVKSYAEKKIFEKFKELEKCDDWVVFHSYGIENHVSKIHGEVDFLVVAPNYGLFILEVKGGRVAKKDGIWEYIDRDGNISYKKESPFNQAKTAMYSILDTLSKSKGNYFSKDYIWGYGVMFPDIEFNVDSLEYNQQQVFDKRYNWDIKKFIEGLSKYYREKEHFEKSVPLTHNAAKEIVDLLKNDFDIEIPIKTSIEYSDTNLLNLTEEQYHVVRGLAHNKRCLIHGGAGTGKTILATKLMKESLEKNETTALFCYNLLLSNKLKKEIGDIPKNCYIGSFTNFLEELVVKHFDINVEEIDDKKQFYLEDLPCLALEALEKENLMFDKIIIDEGQDLVNNSYIDIIDLILKDGLSKGKWCVFGDFEIQTIYNNDVTLDKVIQLLELRKCEFIIYNLTLNCRNTLNIQAEMKKIIPSYDTLTLNKDINSPKVKRIKYVNSEDQIELINNEIRKLLDRGITKKEIIILSPYVLNDKFLSGINNITKYRETEKGIRYATVASFKGLESNIIFMINVYDKTPKEIIFTGCSRAKTLLYIFERK